MIGSIGFAPKMMSFGKIDRENSNPEAFAAAQKICDPDVWAGLDASEREFTVDYNKAQPPAPEDDDRKVIFICRPSSGSPYFKEIAKASLGWLDDIARAEARK